MKFFTAILLVAFVAAAYAAEIPKPEAESEAKDAARGKRGLLYSAYTAPVAAPVVAPVAAAYSAPVAYTYSASYPYPYAPYYSYPAVYY